MGIRSYKREKWTSGNSKRKIKEEVDLKEQKIEKGNKSGLSKLLYEKRNKSGLPKLLYEKRNRKVNIGFF